MIEMLIVYGSLVLLNLGIGHSAALLDSQQSQPIQPFEDRPYEVIIEEEPLAMELDEQTWVAERD